MQQVWVAPLMPEYTGDGTQLVSSSTLTDVSPAPQTPLNAGFLDTGSVVRVTAFGRYSTVDAAETLSFGLYFGGVAGTALCSTGNITPASVTNQTWELMAIFVVRSTASGGTASVVMAAGHVLNLATTAGVASMMPATAPATVTVNTVNATTLTVGAKFGASNASNAVTCHLMVAESIK